MILCEAHMRSRDKHPLSTFCYMRTHVIRAAPTERIYVKFDIEDFP